MKYPYENLSDSDFESLVVSICQQIIGTGCKAFTTGKDGGRDSWFKGTANQYPSLQAPWSGIFLIQAKHTNSPEASCSDKNFHANPSSILHKEIKRLQEIQKAERFDNYILFTNRKLSGIEHPKIRKTLQDGLNISNVEIIGRDELDLFLQNFPDIVRSYGLHKFSSPARFFEKDIQDIILLFNETEWESNSCQQLEFELSYTNKEHKNELNNISQEYFDFIKEHSLSHFKDINAFLKNEQNRIYKTKYLNTVSDLKAYLLKNEGSFSTGMAILEHIIDCIVDENKHDIMDARRLVRIFVHFMYFNCDIGKTK